MRHPFLRSAGSELKDPNFKNVTLLLHGDGTNGGQNNTFVDGSTNNFTITRNGNTTQGTFSPYGDRWSNYFDGTGDYLSIARNNAFLPVANEDFAIEAFVYLTATPGAQTSIIAGLGELGTDADWFFWINSSLQVAFYINTLGTSFTNTTTPLTLNTWTHVAVSRSGTGSNNLKVFVNGVGQSFTTNSTTVGTGGRALTIGADQNGDEGMLSGYVSNLRLVKGSAVYTANFTPPTAPLTAITNTSLLTCQSNRFRDASTNNFTITRNGDVSVQRFSPFSPTAAYAAGTIGGSGYFDGTGDNIYVTSATGLCDFPSGGAFTFQLWFYRLGSTEMVFIGGGTGTFQMGVTPGASGGVRYSKPNFADVFFGPGSVPIGTWTHITLCRNTSNTTRCWINGVSVASTTSDTNAYSLAATYIGSQPAGTSPTNGYLSDMRILKGQALYDPTSSANIAVPTAPLTAITNTSFLLNFQNAAILDNAMMAVPETVGNAQIDTTIKKYGTGSLYFDGTGDWLRTRNTPELAFGTGDFTIECWFYIAGNSSLNPSNERKCSLVSSIRTVSATGISFEVRGNSTTTGTGIEFSNFVSGSATTIGANTTIAQSTWHHVAVVRSGTTTTIYLNGSSVASGTLSNQTINPIDDLTVGANGLHTNYPHVLNGYIDDLRITKGVARYTSNFTAPTAPFPNL